MYSHRCKIAFLAGSIIVIVAALSGIIQAFGSPGIIDTHEHIEDLTRAKVLISAHETTGISKTILVPSPTETLTLNGHKSFTGYRENTDDIFDIAKEYPDKFIPFCTVNPLDSDALAYLKGCIDRGGKGIKLYNGHSYYYNIFSIPLDSPRMLPIYAFAERNEVPLLFHINITKYGQELERILAKYPALVMSVPHFMVSSIGLDRVSALFRTYPNLYTDMSFGSPEFMAAGFRRISKDPGKYANFINEFQDRILFGADMVLTEADHKDRAFVEETIRCYKDILEKRHFMCKAVSDYYNKILATNQQRYDNCKPKEGDYCKSMETKFATHKKRADEVVILNGLGLSRSVLNKVYSKNAKRFLEAKY